VFAGMTDTSFLHGRGHKWAIRAMASFMWDACGEWNAACPCVLIPKCAMPRDGLNGVAGRSLAEMIDHTRHRAPLERGQAKAGGGTQLGFAAKNVADFRYAFYH
jgi:hypothetical protein